MILFLDSETSGLLRDDLDPDDPSQPHLVQLSLKATTDDGKRLFRWTALVQPEGWSIEPEAEAIHGISLRHAMRYGLPLAEVLRPLRLLAPKASRIVGHGLHHFDRMLIERSLHELKVDASWWRALGSRMFDTVEAAATLCGLPGGKFPTLGEAHAILVGIPFESDHDAETDTDACENVYRAIVARLQ